MPLCHHTSSQTNPYVYNAPSYNSVEQWKERGHGHDALDIWAGFTICGVYIPPQGNQSILANGCNLPPQPTPTYTQIPPGPTPTNTQIPPGPTPTNTPIPPGPTPTPIPPTPTLPFHPTFTPFHPIYTPTQVPPCTTCAQPSPTPTYTPTPQTCQLPTSTGIPGPSLETCIQPTPTQPGCALGGECKLPQEITAYITIPEPWDKILLAAGCGGTLLTVGGILGLLGYAMYKRDNRQD